MRVHRNIFVLKNKIFGGDRIWRAHRLEGVVRNRGIKSIKKEKKPEYRLNRLIKIKTKPII